MANQTPSPGRYTAQLTPNGAPVAANTQGWKEVSGFAESAKQFAQGLSDLGEFEVRQQIEEGQAQQTWWLTQRNSADEVEAQELLSTASQNMQPGQKIQPLIASEWQARANKKLEGVTDPRLRQAYMRQLGSISEGLNAKAAALDLQESIRYTNELFTAAVDNKSKYYGTLGYDEVDVQAQLDLAEINSKIASTPGTPGEKAERRKMAFENILNAANMRKITIDPNRYLVGQATAVPTEIRKGDMSLPRGIRNNNPGNIRATGDSWQGMSGKDDAGYAQFDTPEAGLRAMAINLRNQQKLHGLNTVQSIINKYAPSSENPTSSYVTKVSQALGVKPDEPINLEDGDTLATMMAAMIKVENGDNPYAPEQIARAVGMKDVPAAPKFDPFNAKGLLASGNIDLSRLPVVRNDDGTISTARSMSFNDNGVEVLIPTVAADGSGILSEKEAIEQYRKTGQFLGKFDTPESARAFAEQLQQQQRVTYSKARTGSFVWNQGTFEQQQKWIQFATSQRNALLAEQKRQQAIEQADFTSTMDILLNRGQITYADIDAAYASGKISPEKRASFYKTLDDRNSIDAKSNEAMARVGMAVQGVAVLDPKNTEDKKAVDRHFQDSMAVLSQQPGMEQGELKDRVLALVKSYGMVPNSLQGQVRAQLRSSSAQDIVAGADMLVKLREINPQLINDFAEEDIKGANHVISLVQAGFKPEQAVNRAAEALKITPEIRKAREDAYKQAQQLDASNLPENQISSKFDSIWRSDPDTIPLEMKTDFDSIARAEYIRTGSLSGSQDTARDLIARTWGVTSIGLGLNKEQGKHWMKNNPEKFYAAPIAGVDNSEWMKQQLIDDLNADDKLSGRDYGKIDLMIMTSRELTKDGKPQYIVSFRDENGLMQVYGGENFPLLWTPNWETSSYRKKMLDDAKKKDEMKNVGIPILRGGF